MDESLLKAIISVSHYTSWSLSDVMSLSVEDLQQCLKVIEESKKDERDILFSILDYHSFITKEYTKTSDSNKGKANAKKIREALTKKKKRNNFSIFENIYKTKYQITE